MSVYVDELEVYWQVAKPNARRTFGNGKQSCHMACDGNIEELHAMAAVIGLKREWFQQHTTPHYDLTPNKRIAAINAGAIPVSKIELVRKCSLILRKNDS